jgi:hypothetical protein
MKRYNLTPNGAQVDDNGVWVRYDDVDRAVLAAIDHQKYKADQEIDQDYAEEMRAWREGNPWLTIG